MLVSLRQSTWQLEVVEVFIFFVPTCLNLRNLRMPIHAALMEGQPRLVGFQAI